MRTHHASGRTSELYTTHRKSPLLSGRSSNSVVEKSSSCGLNWVYLPSRVTMSMVAAWQVALEVAWEEQDKGRLSVPSTLSLKSPTSPQVESKCDTWKSLNQRYVSPFCPRTHQGKKNKNKKLTHLFPVYSFNTPPFHGFDTSRNPVTLLFACQMHKRMT